MNNDGIEKFFTYARKRHTITLRRASGLPREEWTDDPILKKYRFTSVFRELDKTTVWFREHVRDPLRNDSEVLLATVVFRMLNRITTGEAIFCQPDLEGRTAFDKFLETKDARHLRRDIISLIGKKGPFCTGAYIITSPPGFSKLDGMMKVLQDFHKKSDWKDKAEIWSKEICTLQNAWEWFKEQPWLGTFHSYEIVTDLRWTKLLENSTDKMIWANIGPGCRRGLNRIQGRDKQDKNTSTDELLLELRSLLECSKSENYWPQDWGSWELRDGEHQTCEFDKYERVRLGEGRPRGVFQ